jgi:hypothetical protein
VSSSSNGNRGDGGLGGASRNGSTLTVGRVSISGRTFLEMYCSGGETSLAVGGGGGDAAVGDEGE